MRRSFENLAQASRTTNAGPLPLVRAQALHALPRADRPVIHAVLMALFLSALALVGTLLSVDLAERATFLLSFAAIAGAGWFGGALGGAVATAATTVGVLFFLLPAASDPTFSTASYDLVLSTFIVTGLVVTWFNANLHIAGRRLAGTEHLAEIVVESAPLLVAAADENGNIALFNEACERITGRKRDEVLGQPFVQTLVPMSWHSTVTARFSPNAGLDLTQPHYNPWVTRQGEERFIEWRCYQVPVGGHRWTVGVGIDVTDRKLMEEKLAAALQREQAASVEAKAATLARERFIAVLAHELRNPLQSIVGWAAVMAQKSGDLHSRTVSERISNNARVMARLVDDVMDVARIDGGKIELKRVSVDLLALVRDEVASFEPRAGEKKVGITINAVEQIFVNADPGRVRQMIANLLSNALRFAPPNTAIVVQLEIVDGLATLSVEDEGPGFSAEPSKLFEPFWQGESNTDGLGIGLALVAQLAAMHGGSVSATSRDGGSGARVTFSIPTAASRFRDRRA